MDAITERLTRSVCPYCGAVNRSTCGVYAIVECNRCPALLKGNQWHRGAKELEVYERRRPRPHFSKKNRFGFTWEG